MIRQTYDMQNLVIPITEYDLLEFKHMIDNNETINWEFSDSNGKPINIEFVTEDEYTQRNR